MAVMDAAAIEAANLKERVLERKSAVVSDDGIAGIVDPLHEFVLRRLREVRVKIYVDGAAAYLERRIVRWRKCKTEHE
jgi:16S rRNA C1402 (ribose-2'-O) methylase RsmI